VGLTKVREIEGKLIEIRWSRRARCSGVAASLRANRALGDSLVFSSVFGRQTVSPR
jgi:hypothetical protein